MKIEATDQMLLTILKNDAVSLNVITDEAERKKFIENNYEIIFSYMSYYPSYNSDLIAIELDNVKILLDNKKVRESLYTQLGNIKNEYSKKTKKEVNLKNGMLSYLFHLSNNKNSADFYKIMNDNKAYKDYFYDLFFNGSIDLAPFATYTYLNEMHSNLSGNLILENLCALAGEKSYSFLEEKMKKISRNSSIYLASCLLNGNTNHHTTETIVLKTIFNKYPDLIFEQSMKKDAFGKAQFFDLLNMKVIKYSYYALDIITSLVKNKILTENYIEKTLESVKKLCENIERFNFDSSLQEKSIKDFLKVLLNLSDDIVIKKDNNLLLKIIAEINAETLERNLSEKRNNHSSKIKI